MVAQKEIFAQKKSLYYLKSRDFSILSTRQKQQKTKTQKHKQKKTEKEKERERERERETMSGLVTTAEDVEVVKEVFGGEGQSELDLAHPCCVKEARHRKRAAELYDRLEKVDVTRNALLRRTEGVFGNVSGRREKERGAHWCHDPNCTVAGSGDSDDELDALMHDFNGLASNKRSEDEDEEKEEEEEEEEDAEEQQEEQEKLARIRAARVQKLKTAALAQRKSNVSPGKVNTVSGRVARQLVKSFSSVTVLAQGKETNLVSKAVALRLHYLASANPQTLFLKIFEPDPRALMMLQMSPSVGVCGTSLACFVSGRQAGVLRDITGLTRNASIRCDEEDEEDEAQEEARFREVSERLDDWLEQYHVIGEKSFTQRLGGMSDSDDDDDGDECEEYYYDCGKEGCQKSFFHQHVTESSVPFLDP